MSINQEIHRVIGDSATLAKINKDLQLNQDSSRGLSQGGSTQLKKRLNRPLSSTVHRISIPNGDLNHNLMMDDQIYEDINDDDDPIISHDRDGEGELPLQAINHLIESDIDGTTMNNYLSESLVAQE